MPETEKARPRRLRESFYARYIQGRGIDIGCGFDPVSPDAERYDVIFGHPSAETVYGAPRYSYQYVYSSHLLEHIRDRATALRNWSKLLVPGGYLIVVVPHRDLYEKRTRLPSTWNKDHKVFFLPETADTQDTESLRDLVELACPELRLVELRVCDEGYIDKGPAQHPVGEYSIEGIWQAPNVWPPEHSSPYELSSVSEVSFPEAENISVFIVVGAEASGTKMLAGTLLAGGCASVYSKLVHIPEPLSKPVVIRQSLPHGDIGGDSYQENWPAIEAYIHELIACGHRPYILATQRDKRCLLLSQLSAQHVRTTGHGLDNIQKAQETLRRLAHLAQENKLPYATINYRAFCTIPEYRQSLLEKLRLESAPLVYYDGDSRWYT